MQESTAAENVRWRLRTLNALVLAVSLEAGIERSTAENARRRQRMLYSLASPKVRRSRNGLSGRLPRTLGGGRERSTPPWFRRLVSQIQRIGMLAGEQSEIFFKRSSFYMVKIACSSIFDVPRFRSSLVFPTRIMWSGGFGERDAYR